MATGGEKKVEKEREQETALMSLLISYFKLVGILLGVWFLGYYGFSATWVFIGLFIYMMNLRFRQRKQIQIDIAQDLARNEKAAILARMEDLPSWVVFPDVERAEWLNKIIEQMWPYIGDMVREILYTSVQPAVIENLPATLKSFRFVKIDMGDIAPRVGGVKTYIENVRRDEIVMDMDLIYASDADIKVSLKGLNAGIKDLQIRGTLRIVFKPLIPVSPLIGGFTVFFLTNPTVDFNLTDIANALDIPGLSDTLRSIVVEQIAAQLVLPNKIPIVLSEHVDTNKLKFPLPHGILRIHVIGAKELKAADFQMVGKGTSDPYAVLKVGAQTFKTKVIQNTVEPTWNNYFEAIVDQRSGQVLEVSVFDEDPGTADFLGKCSVDIESVADKGSLDSWMPLEEVKTGMVHLRLTWLNLSTNPAHLSESLSQARSLSDTDEAFSLHSCILMVTADSANNLPRVMNKKSLDEPCPYVIFTVGRQIERTFERLNTCDPRWEENFKFLINDPNLQSLDVEVRDKKSNKVLGTMSVLLKLLLSEEAMTQDQKYTLKESGPDSTITLNLRLRVLTTSPVMDEDVGSGLISQPNQYATTTETIPPPPPAAQKAPIAQQTSAPPSKNTSQSAAPQSSPSDQSAKPPIKVEPVSQSEVRKLPEQEMTSIKPEVEAVVQSRLPGDHSTSSEPALRKRNVGNEVTEGQDSGLGRTQVTVRYSSQRNRLVLVLHQCQNMKNLDEDSLSDPYAKIYILPDKKSKKKTQTVRNSLNPVFDETFEFPCTPAELAGKTLKLSFRDHNGAFSKAPDHMGQVHLPLSSLDLREASTAWYYLQPEEE